MPSTLLSQRLLARAPAPPSPPCSADRRARAPRPRSSDRLSLPHRALRSLASAGAVKNAALPLHPAQDSGFHLQAAPKALVAQKVPEVSLLRSRGIVCRLGGLPWSPDSNPRRHPTSSHTPPRGSLCHSLQRGWPPSLLSPGHLLRKAPFLAPRRLRCCTHWDRGGILFFLFSFFIRCLDL